MVWNWKLLNIFVQSVESDDQEVFKYYAVVVLMKKEIPMRVIAFFVRHVRNAPVVAVFFLAVLLSDSATAQFPFVKYSGNPVLPKGEYPEWNFVANSDPFLILDNDTLKMWFTGCGTLMPDTVVRPWIGYAWSINGINWTMHPDNPVFGHSASGWDSYSTETVSILKRPDAPPERRYMMWYAGAESDEMYDIGFAYSPDGYQWTRFENNPVILKGDSSSWKHVIEGPCVIAVEDTLKMWFAGVDSIASGQPTDFRGSIGYAWSLDGEAWNEYPDNPVMMGGEYGSYDYALTGDPHVIYINGIYHMWYASRETWSDPQHQVGYASSPDGITWSRHTEPVLTAGAPGAWDVCIASFPGILYTGGAFHMWYTGLSEWPLPLPDPYFYEIGYATAPANGISEQEMGEGVSLTVYPNPSTTAVTISAPNIDSGFCATVYSIDGRIVRELSSEDEHSIVWDRKNSTAGFVPSGIYVVVVQAENGFLKSTICLLD